jgi:hypothetical protein
MSEIFFSMLALPLTLRRLLNPGTASAETLAGSF